MQWVNHCQLEVGIYGMKKHVMIDSEVGPVTTHVWVNRRVLTSPLFWDVLSAKNVPNYIPVGNTSISITYMYIQKCSLSYKEECLTRYHLNGVCVNFQILLNSSLLWYIQFQVNMKSYTIITMYSVANRNTILGAHAPCLLPCHPQLVKLIVSM